MNRVANRIRVMVVDADAGLRQGMSRLLGLHPMVEIVGTALSGRTAIPKVASYRPDCVVLNLGSNGDQGLELLEFLRATAADTRGIVIATAEVSSELLQRAVQSGAAEVVLCEAGAVAEAAMGKLAHGVLSPLLRMTRPGTVHCGGHVSAGAGPAAAGGGLLTASAAVAPTVPTALAAPPSGSPRGPTCPLPPRHQGGSRVLKVVGIGVSTGGPKALTELLPRLPADFPLPILLVQHMPPKFTASLAESLDRVCKLRVSEAKDGDRIERGRILIAAGGYHMRAVAAGPGATEVVKLTEDPPECSCRPSVDYLFRSLAEVFGGRTLGVVLTGMGEDGWLGSRLIHQAGGRVLAQNEASSTVFGMPRGPIEAGLATAVALDRMAEAIVQAAMGASCN